MGQIVGISDVKEPPFVPILQSGPSLEIRLYQPVFVAEVLSDHGSSNKAFMKLANYIGAFGSPQNEQKHPLAMTAPVITGQGSGGQAIAMTAPVLSTGQYMQFVLPADYQSLDTIPTPTNPEVTIKSIPRRVVAVSRFTGSFSDSYFSTKLQELYEKLKQDHLVEETELPQKEAYLGGLKWSYAQFNPPFTIPAFRRNEVWIELNETSYAKVRQLIEEYDKEKLKSSSTSSAGAGEGKK